MNIANLTDEELMNMQEAPAVSTPEPVVEDDLSTPPSNADADDDQQGDEAPKEEAEDKPAGDEGAEGEVQKPTTEEEDLSDDAFEGKEEPTVVTPPVTKTAEEIAAEATTKEAKTADPKPGEKEKPAEAAKPDAEGSSVDAAAEYGKLVGVPIKINGKDVVLKDTEEVLRLVQKGGSYAQKMEQLKPARKSAAMLESAGLLGNEVALSHMIDLYNGKPEAIAKMVKDLNIDIFALDMESGATYTPTSHLQTDEQVNFVDTLKEVRTLPGGQEAMKLIDSWDQPSKELVWGNATAIRQIYDYKQSGVYDTVAAEVERRRMLGQIPEGQPFIQSFQMVGEELAKRQAPAEPITAPVVPTPVVAEPAKPAARTPVATGVAPRKQEKPDARAAAAASPRGGVGAAKSVPDIYSMSDADIEKMSTPQG